MKYSIRLTFPDKSVAYLSHRNELAWSRSHAYKLAREVNAEGKCTAKVETQF